MEQSRFDPKWGQYAIFANRMLFVNGTNNQIGRWLRSPKASEKRRINLGTMASLTTMNGDPNSWKGVWLDSDVVLEPEVWPIDPDDDRTLKSTWVYYPYTAGTDSTHGMGSFVVSGPGASKVATNRMSSDGWIGMKSAPTPIPTMPSLPLLVGGNTIIGGTQTLHPFRVGKPNGKNPTFTTNDCTLTFTAGTYEIYGSWKSNRAKIRIQGSVKIVVTPSGDAPAFTGIDWSSTTVELLEGADLEIDNGYRLNMDRCWIGGYYQCVGEQDPTRATGDPHMKAWMGSSFQSTACDATQPDEPHYFEPWHVRIYPIGSQQSPYCTWTVTNTSIVGSLFLPTGEINFSGNSQVYGRVAADAVYLTGTSRVRYDHALDDVPGLTEGSLPERGTEPACPLWIELLGIPELYEWL